MPYCTGTHSIVCVFMLLSEFAKFLYTIALILFSQVFITLAHRLKQIGKYLRDIHKLGWYAWIVTLMKRVTNWDVYLGNVDSYK